MFNYKTKVNILVFTLLITLLVFFFSRNSKLLENNKTLIDKKINLNSAKKEEITRLPFIGEKKANRILEQRKKGQITSDVLQKIVGKKIFTKISSKVSY